MSDINFCNTKEQLNHLGEVVTGKVDGSPTGADIDTSTLPYTGQVRKTLPALEGEYEQSITNKEIEADAAIDSYRLLNKGPYASGITLESKFEYITYNGESYFAANPPYTTTATDPDADGNLFLGGYTTFENVANKIGNKNELSNSNFLTPSPDNITHPNATPESYAAGTQIFSGVYAGDSGCTITLIDGRVNCTAGDYRFKLPNTGGLEHVPVFTSSVSDYDGIPKTTGVSHALVGDEYLVTVTPAAGDVFSVKFEQGSVATRHEVNSLFDTYGHPSVIGVARLRAYGAVGDGVTDDTQAYLDAVSSGYRGIMLDDGDVYLVDDLIIRSNFLEHFCNGFATFKAKATSTTFVRVGSGAPAVATQFKNIKFDGSLSSGDCVQLGESLANYAAFTQFDNCEIFNFTSGKAVIPHHCQETEFNNSRTSYCDRGVYRPDLGYCTIFRYQGTSGYIGRCTVPVDLDGDCPEIHFDGIITEDNDGNCYHIKSPYGSTNVFISNAYTESSASIGDGAIVVNGGAGAYEKPKVTITNHSFHTLTNSSTPNLVVDRGVVIVAKCRSIESNGGVLTTSNAVVHFDSNKVDSAADLKSLYSSLPGKISAIDFDAINNPFLYGFEPDNGTFTPTAKNVTFASSSGWWQKEGRIVTVTFDVTWPTTSDTNEAQITNLPFMPSGFGGLSIGITTHTELMTGFVYSSGINAGACEFRAASAALLRNNILSGKRISGVITYRTND